jgi:hypothetical protein
MMCQRIISQTANGKVTTVNYCSKYPHCWRMNTIKEDK